MISRTECGHNHIVFQSGDYYVFCSDCGARWAAISTRRSEYGFNSDGEMVGCDSTVCCHGPDFSGERIKPS